MYRLLVQQKGLDGHMSLDVGHHLLGNRQDFGLRKGRQGLRRKHGGRRKRLGRLVHQGLEQRQRKVQIFKISERQALAFNKGL